MRIRKIADASIDNHLRTQTAQGGYSGKSASNTGLDQSVFVVGPLANGSGAWPDSSQTGISTDGIAFLGSWGLRVPAVRISQPSNFVRANSLASASVSNVLVKRGFRLCTEVPFRRTSNVTYQV